MGGWWVGEKKTKIMQYSTQLKLKLKLELSLAKVTISQVLLLAVFPLLTVVAVKALRAVLDLKAVVTAMALWP